MDPFSSILWERGAVGLVRLKLVTGSPGPTPLRCPVMGLVLAVPAALPGESLERVDGEMPPDGLSETTMVSELAAIAVIVPEGAGVEAPEIKLITGEAVPFPDEAPEMAEEIMTPLKVPPV